MLIQIIKNKTKLIQYPVGNNRDYYSIPDTVITIDTGAFELSSSLKTVIIGNKVQTIGADAFVDFSSLETVIIKSSSLTFEYSVFWACSKLKIIYYYGTIEPTYELNSLCYPSNEKKYGPIQSVSCTPFNFNVDSLTTVYVPTTYTGPETSFCGKEVTIKKELQL